MRALSLACLTCLVVLAPAQAQDNSPAKQAAPLVLNLPASTKDCLDTLEAMVQQALDIDLLDDQVDEAEAHLERFETACHNGRFNVALEEAKAVEKILATNK